MCWSLNSILKDCELDLMYNIATITCIENTLVNILYFANSCKHGQGERNISWHGWRELKTGYPSKYWPAFPIALTMLCIDLLLLVQNIQRITAAIANATRLPKILPTKTPVFELEVPGAESATAGGETLEWPFGSKKHTKLHTFEAKVIKSLWDWKE